MNTDSITQTSYLEKYYKPYVEKGVNPLSIASLKKISISTSNLLIGKSKEHYDIAFSAFRKIALQKPVKSVAKHSISQFKIRKGNVIGLHLTLRKRNMWNFLDRLIYVNLPRVRQFKGLSTTSFGNDGGYNIGIVDHTVFYEMYTEKQNKPFGFSISLDTSATTAADCRAILEAIGFVFSENR